MDVTVRKSELEGEVIPPASKSYTHRAFIAASLSPFAKVTNPLIAEDTIATLNFCRFIGANLMRQQNEFIFEGAQSIDSDGYVYLANSGTTLRFALGILSLSTSGKYSVVDGDASLRKRPNHQLARTLIKLGANIKYNKDFKAPLWVKGVVKGGDIEIRAESSQFISSLLFALPLARNNSTLKILSTKSKPYIDMTLHVLQESGIEFKMDDVFHIPGKQEYMLRQFSIPSDFSSASYLIAAALLAGKVKIKNMFDSKQGDRIIVDVIREMGGKISWNKEKGEITAEKSELEGVEFDASNTPDLVPTIAVMAAVAKGKTRIYNAEHLRIKEIDRIEGICKNLSALGIEVVGKKDEIEIEGGRVKGGVVDSFGDHRMVLAFSLLGLVAERGIIVKNAEVVSVSFPGYFEVLKSLGLRCMIKR
jgi:3-phosphoshikimate 1-carboxyvinyltransferase